MKKILILLLLFFGGLFSFSSISLAVSEDVKGVLDEVADNKAGDIGVTANGQYGIRDLMFNIGKKVMIPIVIFIGLLIAFIGFYKLMFSDKEDERKKGLNFFIWGTIGVVLMVSAYFLVNVLVGRTGTIGIIGSDTAFDPAGIANNLYALVIKKFFILVMYLVIGILFVILVINLIKLISKPDSEEVAKHSKTIIVWNMIGIIMIIFSKNIIEMFYKAVNTGANDLGVGGPILEDKNIGWLYTVLNYFLGFIAFFITVFIIYQAFLLLTKPDDEQTYKNLKKYFVYAILGVFIIGGVYIITNFFIIN